MMNRNVLTHASQRPVSLILADEHQLVLQGLEVLLSSYEGVHVAAAATNGEQVLAYCARSQPDVVLMDLVAAPLDGPTVTESIRSAFPHIQVIALTSVLDGEVIQRYLQAGAIGYLLKSISADELIQAIHAASHGHPTIDSQASQLLVKTLNRPPRLGHDLTSREHDVLKLLVIGLSNKEIAKRLVLSCGTVRVYVSNVLGKLGAHNRTEAAWLASEHRLVSRRQNRPHDPSAAMPWTRQKALAPAQNRVAMRGA